MAKSTRRDKTVTRVVLYRNLDVTGRERSDLSGRVIADVLEQLALEGELTGFSFILNGRNPTTS